MPSTKILYQISVARPEARKAEVLISPLTGQGLTALDNSRLHGCYSTVAVGELTGVEGWRVVGRLQCTHTDR